LKALPCRAESGRCRYSYRTCTRTPLSQKQSRTKPLSLRLTRLLGCFPCSTLFCCFLPLNSVLGLDLFGLFLDGQHCDLIMERKRGTYLFVGRLLLLLALWDCYLITIPLPLLVLSIYLHLCLDRRSGLSRH
jgi:hypothetical protein